MHAGAQAKEQGDADGRRAHLAPHQAARAPLRCATWHVATLPRGTLPPFHVARCRPSTWHVAALPRGVKTAPFHVARCRPSTWHVAHPSTCHILPRVTGTPIQNDLDEFYSMVHFTNPELLGSGAMKIETYIIETYVIETYVIETYIIEASPTRSCSDRVR